MFKPISSNVNFPDLERELLKKWYDRGIVKKYLEKNNSSERKFSFLDGPITANNPMGVHHAWGRTYKDFWQRFWNMKGRKQRFQNGFDEQGLWVEVEVEKELGLRNKKEIENLVPNDKFRSLEKFINLCKERVKKFSQVQTEQSKRLGYFMDWKNSYHTSSDENNYAIWNFIKVVNEKGWLYKGHDSVPWCPRCGTAISQHEILTEDYKEIDHESVYFKLPIKGRKDEFLLVWTTTPWTIPANVAVAVDPKATYYGFNSGNEILWIMDKRFDDLTLNNILPKQAAKGERSKTVLGKELVGLEYDAPFDHLPRVSEALGEYKHRVVASDDLILPISSEEGTGLVHIATGAGSEDFQLGKKLDLPVIELIDEEAAYLNRMEDFSKKNAKKHPELIIDFLKGKDNGKFLLTTKRIRHRYPNCWRCKTELVWRVVDEWYIAMDRDDGSKKTYREQMIEVTKKINWMPGWGLDRELDWLRNMHDWLISKKRFWGLALPIWECKKCGNFEVIGSFEELKEKTIEGWKEFEGNSPHRPWIDQIKIKCSKCKESISRIPDVGNPWLDAGIVPFSTMPKGWFPADFVTESFPGQFKNWFYSLIAMSAALTNNAPFKNILGFASLLDEKGEAMHKSKGNSIEFNEAADKAGVDVMRWLYLRTNPEHNVNFGYNVLDELRRMFILKLWNVYSFFVTYANLYNFKPRENTKDLSFSNVLDKWILSRMSGNIKNLTKAIEKYDSTQAMGNAEIFITDLSNWYVRRVRDRISKNEDQKDRDQALQTLWIVLTEYSKALAPFTPFISDEIFTNLTNLKSVHLQDWPNINTDWIDKKLEDQMKEGIEVASVIQMRRKLNNIPVAIPLKKISYTGLHELNNQIVTIVQEETNVDRLAYIGSADNFSSFGQSKALEKEYTDLSNRNEKAGRARKIIRKIQQERKNLGVSLNAKVDVILEEWPKEFEEEIKKKALVGSIKKGKAFLVIPYE